MTNQYPENRLARVVRRFPSVAFIWLNEPGWPVTFVSENVHHLLGHSDEEFREGRIAYADLIHPDDRERVTNEVSDNVADNGPEVWEHEPYRLKKADGTWIWVQDNTRSVRDESGTIVELEGIITDVSNIVSLNEQLNLALENAQRRNAEHRAVIAQLSQVEAVVSSSSDLLMLVGKDQQLLYANTPFLKAFDMLDGKGPGTVITECPPVRDLAHLMAGPIAASLKGRSEVWEGWIDIPTKGRQYMVIETRPFVADTGHVEGTVIVARNRTKRHEQTAATQRLAKAIEHVSESIVITDPEGTIEYVNPFFELTTGYSKEEIIGANPRILKSGTAPHAFYKQLWTTLREGKTWKGRFVNRRKNGELFTEDATISPILNENGETTNYVAVKRDVSTEVSIMQQMRLTEQSEMQNQVFRTMLHEFNNRLTIITGHAELLKVLSAEGGIRPESVDAILGAASDVADLVASGMRQVHQASEEDTTVSLPHVVQQSCAMIKRILPETVSFQTDITSDVLTISMRENEVDQIVTNLVLNAAEAIEDQGTIHVEVGPAAWMPTHLKTSGRAEAWAKLVVSDTGCGMSADVQANMFKQFFTTKESDKSSGLGLWTVKHLVDDAGGTLDVESAPGSGTRMSIWLPVTSDGSGHSPSRSVAEKRLKDCHIMVVDDDQAFLEMTVAMVTMAGMQVTSFDDSLQALAWLTDADPAPDLVLTDLIMPSLDGSDLAARIAEIKPDLPVIFMSGYSEEVRRSAGQPASYRYFLQKPFESAALLDLIATALPLRQTLSS